MNNLILCVFGRDVLKTHSITGNTSSKTKNNQTEGNATNNAIHTPILKLDEEKLKLVYGINFCVHVWMKYHSFFLLEIMDARSFVNKTEKLTKTKKNEIIGKKIANMKSYKPTENNVLG